MSTYHFENNEETREALRKQFLDKRITDNYFVASILQKIFSVPDYEQWAQNDSSGKLKEFLDTQLLPVLRKKDEEAWASIANAPSIEKYKKYKDYLDQFGDKAAHAVEANKEIQEAEENTWKIAEEAKTEESLRQALGEYLAQYPRGQHVAEAHRMQRDIPWEITCRLNTIGDYKDFIKKHPQSEHVAEAKRRIEEIADEEDWKFYKGKVDEGGSIDDKIKYLKEYIKEHPHGKHVEEAENLIKILSIPPTPNNPLEKLLQEIKENPNKYDPEELRTKLLNCGGDKKQLSNLWGDELSTLIFNPDRKVPASLGEEKISKHVELDYTEVYFWGLRGTGKTCAIGAVIGYITNELGQIEAVTNSDGFDCFRALQDLFSTKDNLCRLPPRTDEKKNLPCMPFEYTAKDNKYRKVQIVDVAGEVFADIYSYQRNKGKEGNKKTQTLKYFDELLTSSINYKLHFFVIEYGSEEDWYTIEGKDYPKWQVMDAVMKYLLEEKKLSRKTQRIYILVNKCDRIPSDKDPQKEVIDYINRTKWKTVKENLVKISEELCGKSLPKPQPFSIGEVYAKDYCRFKSEDAKFVVDCITEACRGVNPHSFGYKLRRLLHQ